MFCTPGCQRAPSKSHRADDWEDGNDQRQSPPAGKPTNRKPRIFFRASSFKLSNGPWGDAFGRSRIPPRGGGGGTLRKTTHHCCCLNSLKLKQKKTPNSLWNVSSVWSCMVCTVLSTHSSYATCLTLVCEKWTLIVLRLILFHQFFNSS